MTTRIRPLRAGRAALTDDGTPAGLGFSCSTFMAQNERAEWRQRQGDGVGAAMGRYRSRLDAAVVAHPAAAVIHRVGVEHLAPVPPARDADRVVLAGHEIGRASCREVW